MGAPPRSRGVAGAARRARAWAGRLGREAGRVDVAARDAVGALGAEPYLVEAVSKVAALLAPDVVPLMPAPARKHVLGDDAPTNAGAFVAMVDWFVGATLAHCDELALLAAGHEEAKLGGAGALDRYPLVRFGGASALFLED